MRAVLGLLSLVSLVPSSVTGDGVHSRNTESIITSVTPALPSGVSVSIVGSDTFVRVESDGVRVEIPGYEDEEYIRISVDGVVEVNDASITTALNEERYGNVDVSKVDKNSPPRWRVMSRDGIAMWHDHRSHWMSPKSPAAIDDAGKVFDWEIPMVVAGQKTTIAGTLYLREQASFAWWLLGLPAMALTFVLAIARRRVFLWLVVIASAAGSIVGYMEFVGLPTGARITPLLLVFSVGAGILGLVAISASRRDGGHHVAISMNAGAGATLVMVVWILWSQVRAAYVPGLSDPWIARTVLPVMLGVGLVTAIDGIAGIVRPPKR